VTSTSSQADSPQHLGSQPDAAILLQYADRVTRYCRSRTGSDSDADDAAQDTFVRFLQRRDREVNNPEAWLIRAARYACADVNRRARRELSLDGVDAAVSCEPLEDAVVTSALVLELLHRLRPSDARLLGELYVSGWTAENVARTLNVPAGNVRVMAMRARRRARLAFQAMGGVVGPLAALAGWRSGGDRRAGAGSRSLGVRWRVHPPSVAFGPGETLGAVTIGAQALASVVAVLLVAAAPAAGSSAGPSLHPPLPALAQLLSGDRSPEAPSPNAAGARSPQPTRGPSLNAQPRASSGVVQNLLAPGASAQQQDAAFTSVTPSPDYAADRTVYASGGLTRGCSSVCPAVFVTRDGGATWQHLSASGFAGGSLLLPPSYPADPAIFAAGPLGLQRSDDGGRTFRLVVPGPQQAAVQPDSPVGDATILLGTVPLTVYHGRLGTVTPGPTLPAGVDAILGSTFAGDATHLLVAAAQIDPLTGHVTDSVVLQCSPSTCVSRLSFPGAPGLRLVSSPSASTDHTVLVLAGTTVEVSNDIGETYRRASLPEAGYVLAAGFGVGESSRSTALFLIMSARPDTSTLWQSRDGGGFRLVRLPGSAMATSVTPLVDHRLLVTLGVADGGGDFGVRCSSDQGSNWALSC
jgi:RNA polymerase sigma factor (sigma-70 family)